MTICLQCFAVIPLVVLSLQFYLWGASLKGSEKQRQCRLLGIGYSTLGTLSLLFRSLPFGLLGLLLWMLGLRLLAHSLDRIDKTIFIDRLDEDR